MMPLDKVGNELKEGDFVVAEPIGHTLIMRVISIQDKRMILSLEQPYINEVPVGGIIKIATPPMKSPASQA